jgi:hypothetical protein
MAKRPSVDERFEHCINILQQHMKEDNENFLKLAAQIIEVNKDVKSLLESRSFVRGAWWALGIMGAAIATILTLIIEWFRRV